MQNCPESGPRRSPRAAGSAARGVQKSTRPQRASMCKNYMTSIAKKPPAASRRSAASSRRAKELWALRALQEYSERPGIDPNAMALLLRQPREIIGLIIAFLQPEFRVCFSLSCKLALHYTGTSCWKDPDIKTRGHSRLNLMQCLARDAPGHLASCDRCITMHPPLRPPQIHRQTNLTKICMSQWAVIDFFPQVYDGLQNVGYSLLHPHIQEVFKRREVDACTELLSGSYTTSKNPAFTYNLHSEASWVNNRLVLQHTHVFRSKSKADLKIVDILQLPVRICPHSSTETAPPAKSRYLPTRSGNSPLLTHAIVTAFSLHLRRSVPKASNFRDPTPTEKMQMERADAGENIVWKCRGCPTKFQVSLEDRNELKVMSWHCFGADLLHADKYWAWLVRREGETLGAGKRNSEFWFPTGRSFPDFETP